MLNAETHEQRHIRYWRGLHQYMIETGNSMKCLVQKKVQRETGCKRSRLELRLGRTGFGIDMRLAWSLNKIGIWLYVQADNAEAHFRLLEEQREEIHTEMDRTLEWCEPTGQIRKRIGLNKANTDPLDENDWPQQYEWFTTHLELFVEVFQERIQGLDAAG